MPKGAIDLKFWHTSRFGHKDQFFHAQDQRIELEFGLGKNVQTSFYFNRYQRRYSETANGTTVSNEIDFSNEWKWKLSDPTANKVGFALYEEWGIKDGSRARSQETNDSDWDILILLNNAGVTRKLKKEFSEEFYNIELKIGEPVSIFVFSKLDWEGKHKYTPLYQNIKRDGINLNLH